MGKFKNKLIAIAAVLLSLAMIAMVTFRYA